MNFTVATYDKDTFASLADALCNDGGAFTIVRIEGKTTWRELQLIAHTVNKGLKCIDSETSVGLGVLNDKDTTTFNLSDIMPAQGTVQTTQPQQACSRKYAELTTTALIVNNDDITELMKLLPLGNSSHSGLREKLHQASITINEKW